MHTTDGLSPKLAHAFRHAVLILAALSAGLIASAGRPAPAQAAPSLPPIHHVWIIMLENESDSTTFPASNPPSPYLATTLRSKGLYLPNYYATGHVSNDNYISLISGQPPNPNTDSDCAAYLNWQGTVVDGIADGTGCVFPTTVPTIASQLDAAGLTWRSYDQSMATPCLHPAVNSQDTMQGETPGDPYATRHDPFMYFHAIIDNADYCDSHVVNLTNLPADLTNESSTPNYSFITPDVCGDGHDATCTADPSRPGGFKGINGFLSTWVPQIMASPAYKSGLIVITFDEAATSDASDCCGETPGPTMPLPGLTGPGGGDVGAVLLSPYITGGTTSKTAYNHYSLLGSIENLFGLSHIGEAAASELPVFGSDVYNNDTAATGPTGTTPTTTPKRCTARHTVTLRQHPRFPVREIRAVVSINGKVVARIHGHAITRVRYTAPAARRYTLKLVVTLSNGRVIVKTIVYTGCRSSKARIHVIRKAKSRRVRRALRRAPGEAARVLTLRRHAAARR